MRDTPLPVGELARQLPVSRPAVSQHLKVLKEAQLVREHRRGTRHLFPPQSRRLRRAAGVCRFHVAGGAKGLRRVHGGTTINRLSIEPVVKTITVACTPEEAFHYFTADFSMWWPAATHSVVAYASEFKDRPAEVIFEPRAGGRIFERSSSGEPYTWGKVLAWEPPARVEFSFHPGRDEKEAQTVEVAFSAVPEGARVTLTHRGWEKLSDNAQKARDS